MSLPGQPGQGWCGIVSDSPDSIRDTSREQVNGSGKPTQLLFKNFMITSDCHHHICEECLALKEEDALTSMCNLEKDGSANLTELVNAEARAVIKSSKDKDCGKIGKLGLSIWQRTGVTRNCSSGCWNSEPKLTNRLNIQHLKTMTQPCTLLCGTTERAQLRCC